MVAAIVRLVVTTSVTTLTDGTWASADIITWSQVECGCYLVASCLPTYRPFFNEIIEWVKFAPKPNLWKRFHRSQSDKQDGAYLELAGTE